MKIKEKELNSIRKQQEAINKILSEVGYLEASKHSKLHELAGLNEDIEKTKKELEKEYGSISINLEDGSYTKVEDKKLQEDVQGN